MANQKSKLSGGAGGKPAVKTAGKSDVKSDVKTDMKTGAKTGAKPRGSKGNQTPSHIPTAKTSIHLQQIPHQFPYGTSRRSACRYDYLPHLGGRWVF